MPETDLPIEDSFDIPVKQIAILAIVATPVVAFAKNRRFRKRVLDVLFGPEEDFEYTTRPKD